MDTEQKKTIKEIIKGLKSDCKEAQRLHKKLEKASAKLPEGQDEGEARDKLEEAIGLLEEAIETFGEAL